MHDLCWLDGHCFAIDYCVLNASEQRFLAFLLLFFKQQLCRVSCCFYSSLPLRTWERLDDATPGALRQKDFLPWNLWTPSRESYVLSLRMGVLNNMYRYSTGIKISTTTSSYISVFTSFCLNRTKRACEVTPCAPKIFSSFHFVLDYLHTGSGIYLVRIHTEEASKYDLRS
jgi:hypothetical protein